MAIEEILCNQWEAVTAAAAAAATTASTVTTSKNVSIMATKNATPLVVEEDQRKQVGVITTASTVTASKSTT